MNKGKQQKDIVDADFGTISPKVEQCRINTAPRMPHVLMKVAKQ